MFELPDITDRITKEFLLSKHSEETYMSTYLGLPIKKGLQISPIRKDRRPTVSFYRNKNGDLIYHDFGNGFHGNFIAVWNKCKDVVDFLYGIGANGNLSRNIKLNNKRGKLGFSKNGYIWSFFAPQGKEEL